MFNKIMKCLYPLVHTSDRLLSLAPILSECMDMTVSAPAMMQLAKYSAGSIGYAMHKDNTIDDYQNGNDEAFAGPKGQVLSSVLLC